MKIKYNEEILNHFEQKNWWVCSFTPKIQLPDITLLNVALKVRFTDQTLREPFYNSWEERATNSEPDDNWPYITISIYPPYDDSNINNYQFILNY